VIRLILEEGERVKRERGKKKKKKKKKKEKKRLLSHVLHQGFVAAVSEPLTLLFQTLIILDHRAEVQDRLFVHALFFSAKICHLQYFSFYSFF
jgi:hypothetical protein